MPNPLTFNWNAFLDPANDPNDVVDNTSAEITDDGVLTQDTGGIQVGVTYMNDSTMAGNGSAEISDSTQFVDDTAGETFDTTSGIRLIGQSGDVTDTGTVAIDFTAVDGSGFNDEVENVTFRLNDIDASTWRDVITVRAFDADGNLINVDITYNGDTISGTNATVLADESLGDLSPADEAGSALVEIAGPVARIEIDYGNDNITSPQFLWVTDIHFDAVDEIPLDGTVSGTTGDDIIDEDYIGDPDGDLVDNDDAILTGDTGDDDLIFGFEGDDSISAGDGDDEIFGGEDDDTIDGGAGDDEISADAGSDTISVSEDEGTDTITGGEDAGDSDVDTVDFDDAAVDGVDVTLTGDEEGTYTFGTGDGDGTFSEIEAFDLTDQDDTFDGSLDGDGLTVDAGAGDDVLTGGTGADDLDGEDGDDTFVLNDAFGDDTITGGEADETDGDVIDGSGLTEDVTVDFSGPEAGTITSDTGTANFSEVEAIETGAGDDTINGSDGDDVVTTNEGVDILFGGAGDDTLDAGDDDDEITGGTGADSISAGAGDDTITFSDGDTADGGEGDDLFVLEDLGEPENGVITITGGSGDETGGDTLQLGDLGVLTQDVRDTFVDDGTGSFSGTITLDDGTILNFSEIENIICFTPGTRIATPNGLVAIEYLKIGDLVVTRDQGLQPIRWFESRTVPAVDRFAPVRIRKNVLSGQDRDLIVSPQHRVLFQGYQAELLFGEREVLVSAKHLIDGMDVTQDEQSAVTYIHIMFDSHQVIYAEGAATESFHPGDIGMTAVSDQAREELFAIFPELRADQSTYGNTARRCLKAHEAKLIKS